MTTRQHLRRRTRGYAALFARLGWCGIFFAFSMWGEISAGEVRAEGRKFIEDTLCGKSLAPAWKATTVGGKAIYGDKGVTLSAPGDSDVFLERENHWNGTDETPLAAEVWISRGGGGQYSTPPALRLIWDNKNQAVLGVGRADELSAECIAAGKVRRLPAIKIPPQAEGVSVRLMLTSRNVLFAYSVDGVLWNFLGWAGIRPGATGLAPKLVRLGWGGSRKGAGGRRHSRRSGGGTVSAVFRNFRLWIGPVPAAPDKVKGDLVSRKSFSRTIKTAVEKRGVPKKWLLLGPLQETPKRELYRKELLPEKSDDWRKLAASPEGKPYRLVEWEHPDDLGGDLVPVGKILGAERGLCFAEAKLEFPAAGPGLLRFKSRDTAVVWLNGRKVLTEGRETPNCVRVVLRRGRNVVRVKYSHQQFHEWSFRLQLEQTGGGERLSLLSEALRLNPPVGATGTDAEAYEAYLELIRRQTRRGAFSAALQACDEALRACSRNQPYRVRVLRAKFRILEALRDGPALTGAGTAYLKKYSDEEGRDTAWRACVLGAALTGKEDGGDAAGKAASAAGKWLAEKQKRAGAERARPYWALAGVLKLLGNEKERAAVWKRMAEDRLVTDGPRFFALLERAAAVRRQSGAGGAWREVCTVLEQALAMVPGNDAPAPSAFATAARADLQAGRGARAYRALQGALLLALAGSANFGSGSYRLQEVPALPDKVARKKNLGKTAAALEPVLFTKTTAAEAAKKQCGRRLFAYAAAWRATSGDSSSLVKGFQPFIYRLAKERRHGEKRILETALALVFTAENPAWSRHLSADVAGRGAAGVSFLGALWNRYLWGPCFPEEVGGAFNACAATVRAAGKVDDDGAARAWDAFTAAYGLWEPWAGRALYAWAGLRRACGEPFGARRLYERFLREAPPLPDYGSRRRWNAPPPDLTVAAARALEAIDSWKPEAAIVNTTYAAVETLRTAREELTSEEPAAVRRGVEKLSALVGEHAGEIVPLFEDFAFWPVYTGVRESVRRLLGGLTPKQRQAYLEEIGPRAEEQYARTSPTGDTAALLSLAGEYPYTKAAARALNRAGNLLLDRGETGRAASVFRRLLRSDPASVGFSSALLTAKRAYALLRAGRTAAVRRELDKLARTWPQAVVRFAGRRLRCGDFVKEMSRRCAAVEKTGGAEASRAEKEASATLAGNPQRTGSLPKSPTPRPEAVVWAELMPPSLAAELARGRFGGLERFHPRQSYPVAAAGHLFVGTLDSLRAFELKTGRLLWTRTWTTYGELRPRWAAGFPVSCPTVYNGAVFMRITIGSGTALRCFDAETGKVRWSTETDRAFRNMVWLSDPVVSGELAAATYLEPSDRNTHGIATLDRRTGKLVWKTPLSNGNTGWKVPTGRWDYEFSLACTQLGPPAADAGLVYACTGLESLAALDAFSGELAYLTGWPKAPPRGMTRALKSQTGGPRSPVLTDRLVLVAPKDGRGIMACDRETGRVVWRRPMWDGRWVLGTVGGLLLAADDELTALRVADGGTEWTYTPEGGLVGRPALSGEVLYLPTSARLVRINARTGAFMDAMPWDARLGPAANLLVVREGVVGVGRFSSGAGGTKAETWVALYGSTKKRVPLPFLEARKAEADRLPARAAAAYNLALERPEFFLEAARGRVESLVEAGRKKEAVAEITRLKKKVKGRFSTPDGERTVSAAALADSLRALTGGTPAKGKSNERPLDGVMGFAWRLTGGYPALALPPGKASDRFYAAVGDRLYHLRFSPKLDILWQRRTGAPTAYLVAGPTAVVASNRNQTVVYDRWDGRELWRVAHWGWPAGDTGRTALSADYLAVLWAAQLSGYDLRTARRTYYSNNRWRRTHAIWVRGDTLIEFASPVRRPTAFKHFNLKTGRQTQNYIFNCAWGPKWFASDGRRAIFHSSDKKLCCADPVTGKKLWETAVPRLEGDYGWNMRLGEAEGGLIRYSGEEHIARYQTKHATYFFNAADGKLKHKFDGWYVEHIGGDFLRWDETGRLTRFSLRNGKPATLWKTVFDGERQLPSVMGLSGRLLFVLYVHLGAENVPYFFLRILDWSTGRVETERKLPGLPLRRGAWSTAYTTAPVLIRGGTLLYAARDGLYAFAPFGATLEQAAENIKKILETKDLDTARRRRLRGTLADFGTPMLRAFMVPEDAVVDGRPGKWENSPSLKLAGADSFAPLVKGVRLSKSAAPEVILRSGWDRRGLWLVAEVDDDRFVPPKAGAPLESGDALKLVADSRGEKYSCTLALVDGRLKLTERFGAGDSKLLPKAAIRRRGRGPAGETLTYELFVPWETLRMRPIPGRELRLGVVVYDNDGAGVKAAREWGAGASGEQPVPKLMGRLWLVNASRDRLARYVKTAALLADEGEGMRFLERALMCLEGPKDASRKKAQVLSDFITASPSGPYVPFVVGELRRLFEQMGEKDPRGRVRKILEGANCPPALLRDLESKSLKLWVYPDPEHAPFMLMLQLRQGNQYVRVYWGDAKVNWGRNGTWERLRLGAMPPPGKWTLLEINPADVLFNQAAVDGVTFTTYGGRVYFDHLVVENGPDKKKVVMDDSLPPGAKIRGGKLQFSEKTKRFGKAAWTFGFNRKLLNVEMFSEKGPLFSFRGGKVPKHKAKSDAERLKLYRRAAEELYDVYEGWGVLDAALKLVRDPRKQSAEIERYLAAKPKTVHAARLIWKLQELGGGGKGENPFGRVESWMRRCRVSKSERRRFYARFAPCWTDWMVCGPFAASGPMRGLDEVRGPERGVDLKHPVVVNGKEYAWKVFRRRGRDDSFTDLRAALKVRGDLEKQPYCAYAYRKFVVPYETRARLFIGAFDIFSVWVNGRRVAREMESRGRKDERSFPIMLRKGENEVLLEVGIRGGRLGFFCRVGNDVGRPLDNLVVLEPPPHGRRGR